MGQPIYLHSKPTQLSIKTYPTTATTIAMEKDTYLCHPLATPLFLKPASPFTPSLLRSRKKDFKPKTLRKICAVRCLTTDFIPRQQPPTRSPPCSIDVTPETPNGVPSRFPSTPSEYQASKARLGAPLKTTPSSPITPKTLLSSAPVINLIPCLPLNLGLNRVSPASSLSSTNPTSPHLTRSSPTSSVKTHRRASKSDISEARWWIRMYESLVWHMKQQREGELSSCELTFITRLETRVQCRWYPIVETARVYDERHSRSDLVVPVQSFGLHSSGLCEGVPIQTMMMARHTDTLPSQSSRSTRHHNQILDPAQLAAQAILRRRRLASERPLRWKKQSSPGRSSLRREMASAA